MSPTQVLGSDPRNGQEGYHGGTSTFKQQQQGTQTTPSPQAAISLGSC